VQLRAQLKRIEGSEVRMDDVDVLLNDLETTLQTPMNGKQHAPTDITAIPELSDYLKYFKWNICIFVFQPGILFVHFHIQTQEIHAKRLQKGLFHFQRPDHSVVRPRGRYQ